MTAAELHQLALKRNRTIAHNARRQFTLSSFTRWLDEQVEAGLLYKKLNRYYLTSDGLTAAAALV